MVGLVLGIAGCRLASPPRPDDARVEPDEGSSQPAPSLAAPELIDTENGWRYGEPVVVRWRPVESATAYELEAAASASFEQPLWTSRVAAAGATSPREQSISSLPLGAGETVHVRVRSLSDDGRASPWNVTSGPLSLARVRVVSPATSGERFTDSPRVEWVPIPGASRYDVVLHRDEGADVDGDASTPREAVVPATQGTRLSWGEPELRPGVYRVRVRATGGDTTGPWSEERAFRFDPARPEWSPDAGVTQLSTVRRRPLLGWTLPAGAGDARRFEVEWRRLEGGADRGEAVRALVEGHHFRPARDTPWQRGGRYRVRVRAAGEPHWSEDLEVRVLEDPAERFPVHAVAVDPSRHEARVAVSADGRYVAVASIPSATDGRPTSWRLDLLRLDRRELRFIPVELPEPSPLLGARLRASGLDLSWAGPHSGRPALHLTTSADDGAPGALCRYEPWSPHVVDMVSAPDDESLRAVSQATATREARLYFEILPLAGSDPLFAARGHAVPAPGQIWSVLPDGSDLRPLRAGSDPAISPDGSRLACVVDGGASVEVVSPVSGRARRLSLPARPGDRFHGPSWSPRGRFLVLSRQRQAPHFNDTRGSDLVLHDTTTGEEIVLTRSYADDLAPEFVPSERLDREFDGVVFVSDRGGESWDLHYLELPR